MTTLGVLPRRTLQAVVPTRSASRNKAKKRLTFFAAVLLFCVRGRCGSSDFGLAALCWMRQISMFVCLPSRFFFADTYHEERFRQKSHWWRTDFTLRSKRHARLPLLQLLRLLLCRRDHLVAERGGQIIQVLMASITLFFQCSADARCNARYVLPMTKPISSLFSGSSGKHGCIRSSKDTAASACRT